ncbi:MAG: ISNCY family transposase [Acidobacteriaceae bacterium]|nr:ISNCY family transposase [Acidobacteriaceae bacterium]
MTQADRDRLVALKKAKKNLITQREAAAELELSIRQVQRLLDGLRQRGDKVVVHGLRGKPSHRRIEEKIEREAVNILSRPVYEGFGPTLAAEYLGKKHGIEASKETVRQWMMRARLWRGKKAKVQQVHTWRPRRSRFGELMQWDTSDHNWLEGRGEKLYLIAMIDDATSRLFARFVRHDWTEENMRLLWSYLEKVGRPVSFYTDKASLFQTAEKRRRDEPGVDKDVVEMPPTQIGRALRELGITWIAAHSAQAKGRVERNFRTAQDRLVKGMRVAGVKTLEQANLYLNNDYLAWWERELTVEAVNADDAHRPLEKSHNLAASLSYVETRQVRPDYTLRWNGKLYQIDRSAVTSGLRGANVRMEERLDGSLALRHGERYLPIEECTGAQKPGNKSLPRTPKGTRRTQPRGSDWNKNFDFNKAPKVWQAARESGCRREEAN